ncbi:ASCH domain-containing protein [Mesorhizobium sp.]|uniref:ASCH domain-containing protein n=1 Tax=Mesorhizobium sp. TaxID=1871066 RepID=UPI000FEA0A84|nr:ASCH domain-containing protein [Mesorhizobium sp.]RWA62928.1 MAG: ASCH domain-containing protein [Mesorhizobium sp.]RWA77829.1 MAG: ASCH domain-containing protein [Mesorhizobium sp.]
MTKDGLPRFLVALSIKQPWAELILLGRKTIEVRSWPTDFRGPLALHTGKKPDLEALLKYPDINATYLGGFVGVTELVNVEVFSHASWSRLRTEHLVPGPMPGEVFGWRFRHVRRLKRPIDANGSLNLFPVPENARQAMEL